jgi:hypothetical protein
MHRPDSVTIRYVASLACLRRGRENTKSAWSDGATYGELCVFGICPPAIDPETSHEARSTPNARPALLVWCPIL